MQKKKEKVGQRDEKEIVVGRRSEKRGKTKDGLGKS